jgi:small subunit ribosomal protein S5
VSYKNNNANGTEIELFEKVVKINRVNKVVKGGKRLAFRVFVVCGNKKGKVAFAVAKAKEVPSAIKKALEQAKKNFISIHLYKDTIPHEVYGKAGASIVIIRPAKQGTGVIAGGSLRVILEMLGVKNVVGKAIGSRNPINLALASIDALKSCKDKESEEVERNIKFTSVSRDG